jgi:hypothetical protein
VTAIPGSGGFGEGVEADGVAEGVGLVGEAAQGAFGFAGDGRELLRLAGKRAYLFLDPRRQLGDGLGELVDALQVQPDRNA